jgi:hypothetical protein
VGGNGVSLAEFSEEETNQNHHRNRKGVEAADVGIHSIEKTPKYTEDINDMM